MIPVVLTKPGVRFDCIAPAGFRILAAIVACAAALGRDILITSGTDSHSLPDPHARGCAYDIGLANWSADNISQGLTFLRGNLGPLFTVLYEVPRKPLDPTLIPLAYVNSVATGPHFHIQPLKGSTWPPA